MKQKGFTPVVILLIIFAFLTAAYYSYRNYFSRSVSTSSSSNAESITYVDPYGSYSIEYPKNMRVIRSGIYTIDINDTQRVINEVRFSHNDKLLVIQIETFAYYGKTAQDALSMHVDPSKFKITDQKIGGLDAKTVQFQYPDWVQFTEVVKDNQLYDFMISVKGPDQENNLALGNQILSTFKFTPFKKEITIKDAIKEAVEAVSKQKDVQDFLMKTKSGRVVFDHEDKYQNSWVIHVYEDLSDHLATFNWYSVDKTNGAIKKEF